MPFDSQWWLQVEDLEVYEPAVAEEEALPEPEAAPAAKGECGLRTYAFSHCGFSSPLKSFHE